MICLVPKRSKARRLAGRAALMAASASLSICFSHAAPSVSETLLYDKHIQPLVQDLCISCHGHERPKADLNMEALTSATSFVENRKTWEKIREMVETREMPPSKKPQPTEEQRLMMVHFIEQELAKFDCNGPVNPGKVTIRRLNRSEYNNTIRDLVGVDFKPAADFPSDEVGYGFDNIGDVLSLPPLLMEKYLAAAEQIATKAIVTNYSPEPETKRIEAETLPSTANGGLFEDRAISLDTEGEAYLEFEFPETGEYIFRARAFGMQAGPEPPRLAFRVDGKDLHVADVAAVEFKPEVYELKATIEGGKRRLAFAYINNYNVQNHPDPKMRGDRNLVLDYVEIQGPMGKPRPLPASHRLLITRTPVNGDDLQCAQEILKNFVTRAYRRPATGEEVDRLVKLVEIARSQGGNFEEGIQLAMQAVLVSPHFLFRWELDTDPNKTGAVRELNDYEIAARLSYFLWSSMPDEQLFELADKGVLKHPEILAQQARRMLKDPRAKALVDNFGGQWLQIRNLELVTPDPEIFPEFDEELRAAMRKETELFFEAVMREDRSLLEFLDSDFTFVNEKLARLYGLDGVKGKEFQKISLDKNSQRGGILTQASILAITSNATRTSPVQRGKWILEQILGAPPPPPPPEAGELSEDKAVIQSASLRQRLEQHRANPDCSSCHNRMDPLGFAFENFDAIGAWRDRDGNFPIDSSGVLPGGKTISGAGDLKEYLKTQDRFVKTLSEKMLTFALGRGLEYYDKCTTDDIYAALAANDFRFSVLVTEIVKSEPFLMRKKEGEKP